jgi:hypothetical protein
MSQDILFILYFVGGRNQSIEQHSTYILFIKPLKIDLTEGSETSAKLNLTPGKTQKKIHNIQNTAKL